MTGLAVSSGGALVRLPNQLAVAGTHGRFRGAHDTGIPAGTVLSTPQRGSAHSVADVTVTDTEFASMVTVTGLRRVYQRCVFRAGTGDLYALTLQGLATGIADVDKPVFEDCLIAGGNGQQCAIALYGGAGIFRRCEIRGGTDCLRLIDGIVVDDCWIHDPVYQLGAHSDLTQTLGGAMTIRRCSVDGTSGTDVSGALQSQGVCTGVITDCYFAGGAYTWNGGPGAGSSLVARGNRFGASDFGPLHPLSRAGMDFDSSNVLDVTGARA